MAGRLSGKVAIVTGAGSRGPGIGNGKATAILFAREGAKVLCVDVDVARAQETVHEIEEEKGIAAAFAADVTRADDCKAMVDQAVRVSGGSTYFSGSELGRLYRDVLAGIFHPSDDESAHSTVATAWLGPTTS